MIYLLQNKIVFVKNHLLDLSLVKSLCASGVCVRARPCVLRHFHLLCIIFEGIISWNISCQHQI